MRALAFSALLLAVVQLSLKWLDLSPDETSATPMLSPTNNYVSILALFGLVVLPIALPTAFSPKLRWPMICLAFAAMYFNDSRAAIVLIVATVAFSFVISIRGVRALLTLGVVVVAIVASAMAFFIRAALYDPTSIGSLMDFQTNFSNLERIGILIYARELFNAAPLGSGIGPSSDLFVANPYTIGAYPDAHNMLAMLAVELGWLGVVAYAVLFAYLTSEAWRLLMRWDAASLLPAVLLLNTFYDALLFNGVLAVFFWIFLAIVVNSTRSTHAERRNSIPMIFQRAA